MLNVGVIGVGNMGRHHARIYSEIANLWGVSDLNENQGLKIAKESHTEYYPDYTELLKQDLDAVSVAVPTDQHFKIVQEVLNKGIHVLVEKPITLETSEAKQLISQAEKEDLVLAVGHIERFNPALQITRRMLRNHIFGFPISLTARRVSSKPHRIKDVGVILDLGIHEIDAVCNLLDDEIESVYAKKGGNDSQVYESFASILLSFKSGAVAVIDVNWLTPLNIREVSMTCEYGYVKINYSSQSFKVFTKPDGLSTYSVQHFDLPRVDLLEVELTDFLLSVSENSTPLVTGEDGLRALQIALAAVKSANNGSKIIRDEIFKGV